MKRNIAVLGALVLVGAACSWAQTKPGGRSSVTSFPVDTVVTFDVSSRTVQPLIALIPPGNSLELKVTGLGEGQSLEIDFRAQGGRKGPFAKTAANVRGRYLFTSNNTSLPSGAEDVGKVEAWKFDVILRDKGQADVWAIDPMIVIKE